MQINSMFNRTSIISNHNKFNQNSLATIIQNNMASKTKDKEKAEISKINTTLNETLNKSSQSHVLSTVSSIDDLYEPIEGYFKGLSFCTNRYETLSNLSQKLQSNTLSDDDIKSLQDLGLMKNNSYINTLSDDDINSIEKSLQSGENFFKVLIMDNTSSNAISDMDKYITNIGPTLNNLFSSFKAETNVNISGIGVNSVEQFGLTPSNNMNFDQLINANAVNTIQLSNSLKPSNNTNSDKVFESTGNIINTEVFSNAIKLSDNIDFDQLLGNIKNAENKFYNDVVTKLDDINFKYGDVNNQDLVKKLDQNAYVIDSYA